MTEFKINAIEKCTKDLINKGFIEKMKANGDIVYTETFYKEMNRLMNSGKSSVEAYAELGFDSDVFGVNRAMQAGKNARNRARAGYRFTPCNGTVPPSQVEELASMSVEEQLDYFISRNIYLETLLEEIKKKDLMCGGDVLRFKLDFNPSKQVTMEMLESCMENFRRENSQTEYGLKTPLKQTDILAIFGIKERCWRSSMQRQQQKENRRKEETAEHESIKLKIVEIVRRYCCIPGKRIIHKELLTRYGMQISLKRVKKIMNDMRLVTSIPGHNPYKFDATHDHPQTAPANLVNQNFFVAPRRVILSDITYLYYQTPSKEKEVFYLCVFKDAFTAEILGYATSEHMDVDLIREAYRMMMDKHGDELMEAKKNGQEIYAHSDQGSQYLSTTFRQLLSDDGFIQSCSRRGNSQDNAPCESFFQKLKYRLDDPMYLCTSYETASSVVREYIDFYNREAIQMCLGGLSPEKFYRYAVTGIYPFDSYFKVVPELTETADIVQKQLEKKAAEALQRRKNHKKEHENEKSAECDTENPVERVNKDIKLIEQQLNWQRAIINGCKQLVEYLPEHCENAEKQMDILTGLQQEAEQAQRYMQHLPSEDLHKLSEPDSWAGVPWLSYSEKMCRLFGYKPLHIFRKDLQKELRGINFLTTCRKVYRWRNCPAGKEILATAE